MYVDTCKTKGPNGRTYVRHLLRENYRDGKKVLHRTVANLSHCSEEEIAAVKLALRYKGDLSALQGVTNRGPGTGPVYVRLASRTRGHALLVMLAYALIRELAQRWRTFDLTVEEGVKELGQLCATHMTIDDRSTVNRIPTPRCRSRQLLGAARVELPEAIPRRGVQVATRKKLTTQRVSG